MSAYICVECGKEKYGYDKDEKKNVRFGRFLFGAGIWDSWGFGLDYCHYSKP
jgi:hypothetical protein